MTRVRGETARTATEDFRHSTNRGVSARPDFVPRPQIPVDAVWTGSSAIFTVCSANRSIDAHGPPSRTSAGVYADRERDPRPTARPTSTCVHINRDNRESPGAAYRAEDGERRSAGLRVEHGAAAGGTPPRWDPTCKWSAFIVRKERRMNM